MAGKKIKTTIKVTIKGGEATPAPPLGPILGQHGVAIMDFVKAYNDATSDSRGEVVPAVITIYEDRSFDFELRKAPVSAMILKKLGKEKGSGTAPRVTIGELSEDQVREIAEDKMDDLNAHDVQAAMKIVKGTARSMGVQIKE